MASVEKYKAIVIGSGQGGTPLSRSVGESGMAHGAGGAGARRRDVHQRRVHADEDDGRERARGVSGATRSGLRCPHGRGADRYEAGAEAETRHSEFVSRGTAEEESRGRRISI